jgi:hypothetical protein
LAASVLTCDSWRPGRHLVALPVARVPASVVPPVLRTKDNIALLRCGISIWLMSAGGQNAKNSC